MIKTGEAEEDQKAKGCPYLFSDKGKKKEGKDDQKIMFLTSFAIKLLKRNQVSNGEINILLSNKQHGFLRNWIMLNQVCSSLEEKRLSS